MGKQYWANDSFSSPHLHTKYGSDFLFSGNYEHSVDLMNFNNTLVKIKERAGNGWTIPLQEADSWGVLLLLCILSCAVLPNLKFCEPNVAPIEYFHFWPSREGIWCNSCGVKKVATLDGSWPSEGNQVLGVLTLTSITRLGKILGEIQSIQGILWIYVSNNTIKFTKECIIQTC